MLRKHKHLTKRELKRDPLVILAAQVTDFFEREWTKIVATVAIVAVIVGISYLIVSSQRRGAVNAYNMAITALGNDSPEALDLLDGFVDRYGWSRQAEEALIRLGNEYFQRGRYDEAADAYNAYIDKYNDNSIHIFNAFSGLGAIIEQRGDYLEAAELYETYIHKFERSVFMPSMYLSAGKAYYLGGNMDAAKRNLSVLTDKYANTTERTEAGYYLELVN